MNAWLQLVLTLAGVAAVMVGVLRWGMRGFDARVGAVVRAETGPQFAQVHARFAEVDAQFAQVDAQFADVRHQLELVNQRLGSLEGDMSLVKQRLIGVA